MRTAVLRGGSHNGLQVRVENWRRIYSLPKRISVSEGEDLRINDVLSWRYPEDFYERGLDGDFHYRNTVNYKPMTGEHTKEKAPDL